MESEHIRIKECYNYDIFLEKQDSLPIFVIIWNKTSYKKENLPKIYYRIGYYLVNNEDETPFFVSTTEITHATLFYYFPDILTDYPVMCMNINIKDDMKIAFIEIYDVRNKSMHYIIPRDCTYYNPFDPLEKRYTEISWTETRDQTDVSAGEIRKDSIHYLTSADRFKTFYRNLFDQKTTASDEQKAVKCNVTQQKNYNKTSLSCNPMFKDRRNNEENFGLLWLNERYWKIVYKFIGCCTTVTALPVFLLPFIDFIITSAGNAIVENMLASLHFDNLPHDIEEIYMNDIQNQEWSDLPLDEEVVFTFSLMDIASALFSRRKEIECNSNFIDFGDKYLLISHQNILNSVRIHLDPCDPFQDKTVFNFYALKKASKYEMYMENIASDLFQHHHECSENNFVKVRIIGGDIVSLTRNGKTFGEPSDKHPIPSMTYLNQKLKIIEKVVKDSFKDNIRKGLDILNYDKEEHKKNIMLGFNDVETVLYFIDNNVYVLNTLLPKQSCIKGNWCDPNKNSIDLLTKRCLLSQICELFFDYDYFPPSTNDILDQCLKLK